MKNEILKKIINLLPLSTMAEYLWDLIREYLEKKVASTSSRIDDAALNAATIIVEEAILELKDFKIK